MERTLTAWENPPKQALKPTPPFHLKVNTERKVRRRVRAEGWRAVKDKEGRLLGGLGRGRAGETETADPAFNTACYLRRLTGTACQTRAMQKL